MAVPLKKKKKITEAGKGKDIIFSGSPHSQPSA
jgi:hypothetical protein